MRAQEKAKRLQKSNSLTSVWDAVVASEGQRWKINRSWFAEGGEWEEERKRGKKTDSADKRNAKNIQIPQKKDKASIEFKYKCEKAKAGSRWPTSHLAVELTWSW